jgi:hypothetical protein
MSRIIKIIAVFEPQKIYTAKNPYFVVCFASIL